jgi:hypothetical protein
MRSPAGQFPGLRVTTRVAVWVAVHHRAAPFREDRAETLVQLEPIRTAMTRAANAVGFTAGRRDTLRFLKCRSGEDRRAISVPLTSVTKGLSRSLADTPNRRSGRTTARILQIPKLIVRWALAVGSYSLFGLAHPAPPGRTGGVCSSGLGVLLGEFGAGASRSASARSARRWRLPSRSWPLRCSPKRAAGRPKPRRLAAR